MELKIMQKRDLASFVQNLVENYPVEGVKKKGQSVYGHSFFYGPITGPEELCLDFECTVMPPKKYLLPPKEELLQFNKGPSPDVSAVLEDRPTVVFGVHPYDLKAIRQMDEIFFGGNFDPHYQKRRDALLLIGIDATAAAPRAFWASMEAAAVSSGFDLMMTDLGENYVVEVGSEEGGDLLAGYAEVRLATKDEAAARANMRSHISQLYKRWDLSFPKREIPLLLQHSMNHPIWEENASKCLSCGTCNMVCPTCYCFDVWDDMELDLVRGSRLRGWDSCLLHDFAKVATGENFREARTARYRHRFYRKGQYLFQRVLNDVACVGCGRCASSCLPDIADPVEVFNRLKQDAS